MAAEPLRYYRVMCGSKAHSHWLESEDQALKAAIANQLASTDHIGKVYLGPLVWIEVGHRASRKARTLPVQDIEKLPLRNRPVWPDHSATAS